MEDFRKLLKSKGFRATPGRIAILRILFLSKHPLTVEKIGKRLSLNVVTLYRALNDMAEKDLLLRGHGVGEATHFSYPKNHHHHMVCADCGFMSKCATC